MHLPVLMFVAGKAFGLSCGFEEDATPNREANFECETFGQMLVDEKVEEPKSILLKQITRLVLEQPLPSWFPAGVAIGELVVDGEKGGFDKKASLKINPESTILQNFESQHFEIKMSPRKLEVKNNRLKTIRGVDGAHLYSLQLDNNKNLESIDLTEVIKLASFKVYDTPLINYKESLPQLDTVKTLLISGNTLIELVLYQKSLSRFELINTSSMALFLPNLTSIEHLSVGGSGRIEQAVFPRLESIHVSVFEISPGLPQSIGDDDFGCHRTRSNLGIDFSFKSDCLSLCSSNFELTPQNLILAKKCPSIFGTLTLTKYSPSGFDLPAGYILGLVLDHYPGIARFSRLDYIKGNLVSIFSNFTMLAFPYLTEVDGLEIQGYSNPKGLYLNDLLVKERLILSDSNMTSFEVNTSEEFGTIDLSNCPRLSNIQFGSLATVKDISISNTFIKDLGQIFPKLQKIMGNLTIKNFHFPALYSRVNEIDGFIILEDNPLLLTAHFQLHLQPGQLVHANNPVLRCIRFYDQTVAIEDKGTGASETSQKEPRLEDTATHQTPVRALVSDHSMTNSDPNPPESERIGGAAPILSSTAALSNPTEENKRSAISETKPNSVATPSVPRESFYMLLLKVAIIILPIQPLCSS